MILDEKVDLVLRKLNGSEGAQLGTMVQEWLTPEHSNTVDNEIIIDLLIEDKLVRQRTHNTHSITAKGRRINDRGGWLRYSKDKKRATFFKRVVTWSNVAFAAINISILIYSTSMDNHIEEDVDNLTKSQNFFSQGTSERIDAIEDQLDLVILDLNRIDSIVQTISNRPKTDISNPR